MKAVLAKKLRNRGQFRGPSQAGIKAPAIKVESASPDLTSFGIAELSSSWGDFVCQPLPVGAAQGDNRSL